jgi:hypothetical protein
MVNGREYLISTAKYLKLDISIPHEAMLAEAIALRELFIPYRQDEYAHVGWHALPIIGLSSKQPYAWNSYNYNSASDAANDIVWTEISKLCPITTRWLREMYPSNHYGRVRFMLLEAGGSIGFHTDTEYSILGAINIALNNPPNCRWHWKDNETLEFNPGDAYSMNISYEHSIKNESNQDRYHMIIHHYDSTDEWKQLITRAMEKYEITGNFYYSTELF